MNKRGVSPLIATVLLISFAVTLGAVVMNWAGSLSELSDSCQHQQVTLVDNNMCLDLSKQQIRASIQNNGDEIIGVGFKVMAAQGITRTYLFEHLDKTETRQVGIVYDQPLNGIQEVLILPIIGDESEPLVCETGIAVSSIGAC